MLRGKYPFHEMTVTSTRFFRKRLASNHDGQINERRTKNLCRNSYDSMWIFYFVMCLNAWSVRFLNLQALLWLREENVRKVEPVLLKFLPYPTDTCCSTHSKTVGASLNYYHGLFTQTPFLLICLQPCLHVICYTMKSKPEWPDH